MSRQATWTTRPVTLLVAMMALFASLVVVSGTAQAHPGIPSDLFDPPETAWASVRDLTSAQFATKFDELTARGLMVVDLEVDVIDGKYRAGAVFQANPDRRGWFSHRDLTNAQYQARWEELRAAGFRLIDQETYVVDGQRRYAGVWLENREGLEWASFRGLTSAGFSQRFEEYRQDFLPVDVDVYPVGSGVRYAAVWVKNGEKVAWRLRRGLTPAKFADVFDAYAGQGFRMLDVESVATGDGQRYAGIWVKNTGRGWYQWRDLTATQFRNRWNRALDEGYRLVDYEKYATAAGPRYAGIWRQNSDRPNWALKDQVDALVQAELDEFDVPGFSVAIAHQGEVVYERGFGHQDVAGGVWMHGRSVQRLASVSKAVAGVLLMEMLDQHAELDLTDEVRDHLPQLPEHHTYSVGQTVSNRSCVDHYPDGFGQSETDHYDTALAAVTDFMGQGLSCVPGQYLYSTAAYSVFGAVVEGLEGQPVADVVVDEISQPFGLATLRPEHLSASVPERVTLYDSGNDPMARDDLSWKVLGGGLESSAHDLVRFGMGLLDGTILDAAQREAMWTPPAGKYAYGWDVATNDKGVRVAGKAGGQPGANSYLRIYPDEDIVIVVLANRQGGGHSSRLLSLDIGNLMLDQLS